MQERSPLTWVSACAYVCLVLLHIRPVFSRNMTNRGKICDRAYMANRKSHMVRERLWRNIPSWMWLPNSHVLSGTDHGAEKERDAHSACRCVSHVCHARMESVLVIVGWENMAREISDSGFMRASSRGERRISILTFLRSCARERAAWGRGGGRGAFRATTMEFL